MIQSPLFDFLCSYHSRCRVRSKYRASYLALVPLLMICISRVVAQLPADISSTESKAFRLPVVFEPNRGQANRNVQFLARGSAYTEA